jgi:hypothetical protein
MAWMKLGGGYNGDAGGEAPFYWYNNETGETSQYDPTPSGQYKQVADYSTEGQSNQMWVDAATGRPVTGEEANRAAQQQAQQKEAEFMGVWNNPNASSWDKLQAVQNRYGIETVAQLAHQGHFSDVPELGGYIAARQREANDAGFTIGGNKLGLWPVALGMGAAALYGGTAAATTSAAAAPSAAGIGSAGATQLTAVGGASGVAGSGLAGGVAGLGQGELAALIESGTVGTEGAALEGAAGIGSGAAGATSGGGMEWWDELMMDTGEYGMDPAALESGYNPSYGEGFYGETSPGFGLDGKDILRGAGLAKSLLGGAGDLLGGLKGVLPSADKTAALVPILAAINYAKNQGGFDTSRLESTYDQFDPNALAFDYDQNTLRGREGLTSSLTNRGVMGSSFGNNDITNFNTTRDMGRRSLVSQGILARTDPAKAILDAQIKERALKNQLYGQSLLSIGNVFGGKR